jgi:hypothetical protein
MPLSDLSAPLFAALLFVVLSSPPAYRATNSILKNTSLKTLSEAGAPTKIGILVHAAVFFLLSLAFIKGK